MKRFLGKSEEEILQEIQMRYLDGFQKKFLEFNPLKSPPKTPLEVSEEGL